MPAAKVVPKPEAAATAASRSRPDAAAADLRPTERVLDIDGMLLPQKNAPSRVSTMRANAADVLAAAGAVLAHTNEHGAPGHMPEPVPSPVRPQMTSAAAVPPPVPRPAPSIAPETPVRAESGAGHPAQQPRRTPSPAAPVNLPAAKIMPTQRGGKNDDVPALHTFRSDVEDRVRKQSISLADILTAQEHRAENPVIDAMVPQTAASERSSGKILTYAIGGVFVLAAAAVLTFVFFARSGTPAPVSQAPADAASSFIHADSVQAISIPLGTPSGLIMQGLDQVRSQANIPLGLVSRLYLVTPAPKQGTQPAPLPTLSFMSMAVPTAPPDLVRALNADFFLGLHSFDGTQPFLIFKTDSYTQAFAGMLTWETAMQKDLSPLFTRTVRPTIPEEGTTTPALTPELLQSPFIDRVVDNHDSRVIQDANGNILLLWTFIDRNTLVITTNESTLREVISRLADAPTVLPPGQ